MPTDFAIRRSRSSPVLNVQLRTPPAAKIGATGVVIVVENRVTEQKVQRPAAGAQQPIGTSGTPGGGGVATLPTQTGRTEEITIRVHQKEITGVVIRSKK